MADLYILPCRALGRYLVESTGLALLDRGAPESLQ